MGSFAIGYCHPGLIHQQFHYSLQKLVLHDITHDRLWRCEIPVQHLYVSWARNVICAEFLKLPGGVEWLLMMDTDMTFEDETAYRLMGAAGAVNARIMSALYFGYCSSSQPGVLFPVWYDEAPDRDAEYATVSRLDLNGPQPLGAVGMGCCLIHREVLEAMAHHYRDQPLNSRWFGFDVGREDRADTKEMLMGEDLSFCRRAKVVGFPTWGDARVQCGHIKRRVENFTTWTESNHADRI